MRGRHVVWLGALLCLAGLLLALTRGRETRTAALPARPALASPAVRGEPLAQPALVADDAPEGRVDVPIASTAELSEEHAPLASEKAAERTLLVRVVDERRAPQPAVRVRLRIEGSSIRGFGAETDRAGLAAFRVDDEPGFGERARATASIEGLFERRVEESFLLARWPKEPLELVLPDHGAVVVEVVDEQGARRKDVDKAVYLGVEREEAAGAQLWGGVEGRVGAALEEGRARFPLVGLGLPLSASVDARPVAAPASTTFRGPERPGEEVVGRLEVVTPAIVLSFRALDETGAPLARATLETQLTSKRADGSSIGSGGFFVETDEKGRARLPLHEPWQEGVTLTLGLIQRGPPERTASMDLSRAFPEGESDLGDVRLRAAALLVAGRVVDEADEPVESVAVTILEALDQGGGALSWQTVLFADTAADGSFAFHDDGVRGDLRLAVSTSEFMRPPPLAFARGERDLRIVLAHGGAIEGSIVSADGMLPNDFRVELGGGAGEPQSAEQVASDGTFALRGLAPGSVDVALRLAPGNVLLLEVPSVLVIGGETTRDPRLQEIELARLVTTVRIGVRLPDGRPATSGWVRVLAAAEREAGYLIEGGEALVTGRAGPLDLEVQVTGCRIERLLHVERDTEVRLQSAFHVRIELASGVELPPQGSSLQVRLQRQARPGEAEPAGSLELFRGGDMLGWWNESFGDESNSFGASREVLVSVQEPGTYRVGLFYVTKHADGGMISWSLETTEQMLLELDERNAEETFRVTPEPEAYADLRAGRR